ncbi:MAG: hypothetical protein AAB116_16895, partial [Candidatus Poribacteria bacterium]
MNDLIIHEINIAHYRLIELTKLADQAKPFYNWVEKHAKRITGSHRSLNEILFSCSKMEIEKVINACYSDGNDEKPLLFDGIGRVYPHAKACFYFFAWMIRDAPQQRLSPLISRMQKVDNVTKLIAETDSLVELIFEYRTIVKSFEWHAIREVVIDRLEGSRRSISGHNLEANVRTSLITAIQHYYSIYGDYGRFKKVEISDKQIKVGKHTIDVSVDLIPKTGNNKTRLLIPVKTRETEGGGHSHLFTRDIITAITDIKSEINNYHIVVIIIAENWSASEMATINKQIDMIFYFNMNPNKFIGFDEESQ